jgi:hypothetical protein
MEETEEHLVSFVAFLDFSLFLIKEKEKNLQKENNK